MATLCYITTCKGRLGHLQQTLARVVGQPGVSCVVVDYACPDHAAAWVATHFPQVTVVRVTGEAGFSAARARNLGAQVADAPWLAFFDADIVWSPQLASTVIPSLQAQHRINRLYLQAKLDLLRLLGGPLPLQTRKEVFGEVGRTLRQAADAGHPAATLSVHLPANLVSPPPINGSTEGWRIKRSMVYSFDVAAIRSERTRPP